MRKRTVTHIAKTIFWYLLYFMPTLTYALYIFAEPSSSTTLVDFGAFMTSIGFGFVSNNFILTALSNLFGAGGLFPLFSTSAPLMIFAWFICVYLLHIFVDFILFIPRLIHKVLNKFTGESDSDED